MAEIEQCVVFCVRRAMLQRRHACRDGRKTEERWKPTEEIEVGERSLQVFCILPFFMSEIIKTNLGSFHMKAKKYRLIAGKEKGERYGEKEKSVDVSVLSQKIIGSEGDIAGALL